MKNNLKNYLDELLQKGPLTTDEVLTQIIVDIKAELKESFKSTCKRTYKGTKKRVWTLKKEN